MNRAKVWIRIIIITVVLISVGMFIPVPYVLVQPGTAEDLKEMVEVEEGFQEREGAFYLVTVKQVDARLTSYLYGLLHPQIEVLPREEAIPPEMDREEYRKILQQMMQESQAMAKIIAFEEAGYTVEIKSKGVQVHDFLEGSPAKGILRKGDIIREVDGQSVEMTDQVVSMVQGRQIGDNVRLKIEREGEIREVECSTTEHDEDAGKPALGIYITALDWEAEFPREVNIDVHSIGGPSAGVMFVLEIMNQLTEGDLTAGDRIAGTGTINYYREVGTIGGVRHKVAAAEKAGAEYFIVPRGNYREAASAVKEMELVPVEEFSEVLQFLERINSAYSYNTGYAFIGRPDLEEA